MSTRLYVGNLSFSVDKDMLATQFGAHGRVESADVVIDRETGSSKGFGFVEMGTPEEARSAIDALNGVELQGRAMRVSEAKPRENKGGGNGDNRSFGGGRRRNW